MEHRSQAETVTIENKNLKIKIEKLKINNVLVSVIVEMIKIMVDSALPIFVFHTHLTEMSIVIILDKQFIAACV